MAQVFDPSSGQWIEVPDEQVTALVGAGRAFLPRGKVQVVDARGVAGEVPAEDAPQAFANGYRYRSPAEIQAEQERERYSDRPVAAGIAGAARGITLGLSDVAATATGLVEPETLRGLEDYNEEASIGGEVLGTAAVLLGSGGTATPAAIAEKGAAKVATATVERLGGGVVVRGAVKGGVEGGLYGLGRAITDDAQQRDPLTAEKAMASTMSGALFGAGFGALFGKAGEVLQGRGGKVAVGAADDAPGPASLLDDEVTQADTVVSRPAAGGGASGGPSGGVADAIADGAVAAAKPIKDAIEQNAGVFRRVLAAFDIAAPDADEWVRRGLDIKKKGERLLRGKDLLDDAPGALRSDPRFSGVKNLSDAARLIGAKKGEALGEMQAAAGKLDEMVSPGEQLDIAAFAARAEKEIVAPLARGTVDERRAAGRVREELAALVDGLGAEAKAPGRASFSSVVNWLRRMDDSLKWDHATPNEVRNQIRQLRRVRGLLNESHEEVAERVAKKLGSPAVFDTWKKAKTLYGQMAELDAIAADRLDARTANRLFSLTDNIAGAAGFAVGGGLNPAGMALSLGAALLNKWGRENLPFIMARAMGEFDNTPGARKAAQALINRLRGPGPGGAAPVGVPPPVPINPGGAGAAATPAVHEALVSMLQRAAQAGPRETWVAHTLLSGSAEYRQALEARGLAQYTPEADAEGVRRASTASRVEKAAAAFDSRADAAARGLLSGRRGKVAPTDTSKALAKAEEVRRTAREPEAVVSRVASQLAGVGADAPGLASEMQATAQRAHAFLASKAPARPTPLGDVPALRLPWQPSAAETARWVAYVRAVEDPASVLEDAAGGRLAPEGIEALGAVYPALLADLRGRVLGMVAEHPRRLDYQQRLSLGLLLGLDLDESMSPTVVASIQQMHQQQPEKPKGRPEASSGRTQKRLASEFSPADGLTQRGA